jgi:acyl-CoA synthetase (NDP forming)
VLELLDDCAAKEVLVVELFTGRFSETGRVEAADLERDVLERARAAGIRLIGPNCMGLHDPAWGMSFRPDLPKRVGPVAFLSQSGNNTTEVLLHADVRGLGFSTAVSYGNALDIDESDFLEYFAQDGRTSVIGAYVEGVHDGRRFLSALRTASAKPVVVLKGGRTSAGARTAASHTASLAGSRLVWSAAIRQAGAIEASHQEELLDLLVAFTFFKSPSGASRSRVGIVGGGGGRGVQSADACVEQGLDVPALPDAIRQQLKERSPLWDWIGNPVDQSILAGTGAGTSGAAILEMMMESQDFDLLIANVGEDWVLGRPDFARRLEHIVARFVEIGRRCEKPLAFVLGPADSPDEARWRAVETARSQLVEAQLAVFPTVERAALALRKWAESVAGR